MLSDHQRQALRVFCDTIVAPVEREDDPDGFWARKASDLNIAEGVEEAISAMPDEPRTGMVELIDALAGQGIASASKRSREQIIRGTALMGRQATAGVGGLIGLTLFLYYGAPDPETGQNPNWRTFGYPGPTSPPPQVEKPLRTVAPDGDELTLEADVCIVGSGPGGSTIAGRLAAEHGLDVVVLEAGGYFNEADFMQLELHAYQNMWWRGGPQTTADFNISLQAGSALGGGSVINWTNCLRTTPWVREQWASGFGLEGLDGPEYDHHLDAVLARIGATDTLSELNPAQQHMKDAADALGWSFKTVVRNADPERYSPEAAGYLGFADQSGSKNSTDKTFLKDAFDNGAQLVTRCFVERVLVENGRATGVEGTWSDPETGRSARVTVNAPTVVVACGSLESPALLLRSGIGGPAAGDYLRLHPCTAVSGYYDDDTNNWWGAPHAGLIDEFANVEDGYGFLIEGTQYAPALIGSAVPWSGPEQHKQLIHQTRKAATVIGLLRDHGHGRVTVDADGQAVPTYALTDELDVRNTHRAIEMQVRAHVAAGARAIVPLAAGTPTWRPGDDIDAFIAHVQRIPLRFGGWRLFAAHQMGSCRMGTDPATSVAGPWGELHDVEGVWIGDGSAFPTSSGTNPMVTIMALAHRNAEAIAAAAGQVRGAAPVAAS